MNQTTRLLTLLLLLSVALAAPAGAAPQLTTLVNFDSTNGEYPESSLIQGSDGNFYGTTAEGGSSTSPSNPYGYGTVFKVTPSGTLTTLVNFMGGNGADPFAGLLQGRDGNLYGTTFSGGNSYVSPDNPGAGTVFKLSPAGILTTLYSFNNSDGAGPFDSLIQGSDGTLYGTTYYGGESYFGTAFKLSPPSSGAAMWSFATLVNFMGGNGADPVASLLQGSDGTLYGTTSGGGSGGVSNGYGTIFKMASDGSGFATLVNFTGTNGGFPSRLIQDSAGNLYGTTQYGGSAFSPSNPYTGGTVFKLSRAGTLATIATFTGGNGTDPNGGLLQGLDGNFYGTTFGGGSSYVSPQNPGYGTVFRLSPAGALTTLVNFDGTNGADPFASLLQGSDGALYGTTLYGGSAFSPSNPYTGGTVFELTLPDTASPATVTRLSPATLQAGSLTFPLTVTGTGFSHGVTADFNGTTLTPAFAASTKLTFNVPASLAAMPASFNVTITNPGAIASNTLPFTVTPGLTLTGVSPASAPVGNAATSITVTGTNFVNGCIVKWNGQPLLTYYLSPTQATATVPASLLATAGTASVTISNPHVYATAPLTFTVTAH